MARRYHFTGAFCFFITCFYVQFNATDRLRAKVIHSPSTAAALRVGFASDSPEPDQFEATTGRDIQSYFANSFPILSILTSLENILTRFERP